MLDLLPEKGLFAIQNDWDFLREEKRLDIAESFLADGVNDKALDWLFVRSRTGYSQSQGQL